jgi:hypothetical protein
MNQKFIRRNKISRQGSAIIGDSWSNFSTFPILEFDLYLIYISLIFNLYFIVDFFFSRELDEYISNCFIEFSLK